MTALLLLTLFFALVAAAASAYLALQFRSGLHSGEPHSANPAGVGEGKDEYLAERRLAVYRETVRLLTMISLQGTVARSVLVDFHARTSESAFFFPPAIASYIDEIYARALALQSSTSILHGDKLPVGTDRDKLTVENASQMIWLTDQLPKLVVRFQPYLADRAAAREYAHMVRNVPGAGRPAARSGGPETAAPRTAGQEPRAGVQSQKKHG